MPLSYFFTELPIIHTLRKTGVEKLLPAKTGLVQTRTHSIKENWSLLTECYKWTQCFTDKH